MRPPAATGLLVLALGAGAAGGLGLTPWLVRTLPHDATRVGHLLAALDDPAAAPGLVLLGDSVAMFGLDAAQVGAALPDRPAAWHLATNGQTLAEAHLLLARLPASVRTVVQVVTPGQLHNPVPLPEDVYNAYVLFGYTPPRSTAATLSRIYGPSAAELLGRSELWQRAHGRWVFRQSLDIGLRRWLRPELDLARVERDLAWPAPRKERLSGAKLDLAFHRYTHGRSTCAAGDPAPQVAMLAATAAAVQHAGRRLVVVRAPVHPRLRDFYAPLLALPLDARLGAAAAVVDHTALLAGDAFLDAVHPTRDGARAWSAAVARALGEVR